ncbi:hypothetical protein A3D05_02405 [Candidatus Gottesmanbacteria bacterium RIFCSPHIGHO2_02_FULL_40_24]|nr:MAG: hypothetical protein A3D05_02405 [Candidatus Gottesmanbacteria bacterium RIFCSPHIGHO2_02_FULL_40_24]OGG22994.1 MAG: hypothetical protein A3E42_06615 [Candidatus Gottesmanbacteria bacterium RIFCSPHIGHO2_12_FULL_40_13]OGG23305.1 MAG: hypothetical protein A3B48_06550 [Candidatus Gottesmanbacteria bacterium RIFCSPLOWO2_01_FULL_40_10]OGG31912.1 MAG: hypothetical protein A3I80_02745 [Candidatus Gottesmanbacteria bacterium RIFCSPLOWO2_02_FULL_40_10]
MFLLQAPITNPVIKGLTGKLPKDAPGILATFIAGLIGLLLVIGTLWAFFQFIIGAFNWISSSGDKGKLESAQQRILQAVIGLIVVFAAWAIFIVLLRFLGVTGAGAGGQIQLKLPTLF